MWAIFRWSLLHITSINYNTKLQTDIHFSRFSTLVLVRAKPSSFLYFAIHYASTYFSFSVMDCNFCKLVGWKRILRVDGIRTRAAWASLKRIASRPRRPHLTTCSWKAFLSTGSRAKMYEHLFMARRAK